MQRIYVHPLPVRIWHWINALGFIALIVTGIQIRYVELIGLLSFRSAVQLHNWVGFVLIANFFVWFLFYLFRPPGGQRAHAGGGAAGSGATKTRSCSNTRRTMKSGGSTPWSRSSETRWCACCSTPPKASSRWR
mgnify:CR=1 FL=1